MVSTKSSTNGENSTPFEGVYCNHGRNSMDLPTGYRNHDQLHENSDSLTVEQPAGYQTLKHVMWIYSDYRFEFCFVEK